LRYVEIAQYGVEIAVNVLHPREVRACESELDERVVDKVFSASSVAFGQPQSPRAEVPVTREEQVLMPLHTLGNFQRL
jgi:hypothetical protein